MVFAGAGVEDGRSGGLFKRCLRSGLRLSGCGSAAASRNMGQSVGNTSAGIEDTPARDIRMVQTAIKTNVTLDRIRQLLAEGRAEDALVLINQRDDQSDLWQNARGVCLLRLGLYERAVQALRRIVFSDNAICVPEGIPALYRANFATALLLTHHMEGAIALIEHLEDDGHPYVRALRQAAQRWKQGLTLLQRMGLWAGWYPKKPVQLDFPPGGT